MGFASECRPGGAAKFLAVVARRDGSDSRFSCRANTPAPDSPEADLRFRRRNRLTRGADLRALAREGEKLRTATIDIWIAAGAGLVNRIGFIVPKYGHSAVRRNRLKRILRELTRTTLLGALRTSTTGATMDIVMRARPSAYSASHDALTGEFERLRGRLVRWRASSSTGRRGEGDLESSD
jgi:ribonuclease P protein component